MHPTTLLPCSRRPADSHVPVRVAAPQSSTATVTSKTGFRLIPNRLSLHLRAQLGDLILDMGDSGWFKRVDETNAFITT
jgi:hypothetical protein